MNTVHLILAQLPVALGNPSATIGQQVLDLILSPTGLATGISLLLGGLGLLLGSNEVRRRQVALAIHHGFLIAEDIASETPGEDAVDKIAAALKAADAYCTANGWRALKPGEQDVAKLTFTAQNGAQKVAEKIAANTAPDAPKS